MREGETINRALIIGGTGMLADTSRWIAAHARQTVLAARHPEALATELDAIPWAMDWTDQCSGLSHLMPLPDFDLVLAWLHRDGQWMAEHLQSKVAQGGRFVQVHGAAAGRKDALEKRRLPPKAGVLTQHVILGHIAKAGGKRWLSKAEIGAGVIAAIKSAHPAPFIVGSL